MLNELKIFMQPGYFFFILPTMFFYNKWKNVFWICHGYEFEVVN